MRTKFLDFFMFLWIGGIIVTLVASFGLGMEGDVDGGFEMFISILFFTSILIMYLMMLICLMEAVGLPKGTERNLWILGILFMTQIAVPYFYFRRPKKNEISPKKTEAEPN